MTENEILDKLEPRLRRWARTTAGQNPCEAPDLLQVGRIAALAKIRSLAKRKDVDAQQRNIFAVKSAREAMERHRKKPCNRLPVVELREDSLTIPEPEGRVCHWVRVKLPEETIADIRTATRLDARRLTFSAVIVLAVEEFLKEARVAAPDRQ